MGKDKISIESRIFGFSIWMLLFTYEGSFMIQSLIGFIAIMFVVQMKKKCLKFGKYSKALLVLFFYLTFSTVANTLIHIDLLSEAVVIGILYFALITIWFWLNTNDTKNSREINFIINNYIYVMTIVSIFSIYHGVILAQGGKIAYINFLGTEIDENYSSALISMSVVFLFLKLIFLLNSNKKGIIKWIILFVVNVIGVAVIGSRASMLSCILAMVVGFCIYFGNKISLKKILLCVILILFGIGIIKITLNYMPEWTYQRYFQNSYADKSNSIRLIYWKNAITATLDSPLFGMGFGFYKKIPKYQEFEYFSITPESAPAHQTFLDIMIYGGFIGVSIFILFIGKILKNVFNRKNIMILPIVINLLFISNIIGADRSVFFWNSLIIVVMLIEQKGNLKECFK